MTPAKHTPGPWFSTWSEMHERTAICTWDEKLDRPNGIVAFMNPTEYAPNFKEQSETSEADKANARLIAAAPELLEALSGLLEVFTAYVDVEQVANADIVEASRLAVAAIAKARGQQ